DAELPGRLAGDDVDHARGGVRAEQRALRAAQDLDAIHVEEVAEGGDVERLDDVVDDDADGRAGEGIPLVNADAPDGERRRRADIAAIGELHVGNRGGEIAE